MGERSRKRPYWVGVEDKRPGGWGTRKEGGKRVLTSMVSTVGRAQRETASARGLEEAGDEVVVEGWEREVGSAQIGWASRRNVRGRWGTRKEGGKRGCTSLECIWVRAGHNSVSARSLDERGDEVVVGGWERNRKRPSGGASKRNIRDGC